MKAYLSESKYLQNKSPVKIRRLGTRDILKNAEGRYCFNMWPEEDDKVAVNIHLNQNGDLFRDLQIPHFGKCFDEIRVELSFEDVLEVLSPLMMRKFVTKFSDLKDDVLRDLNTYSRLIDKLREGI